MLPEEGEAGVLSGLEVLRTKDAGDYRGGHDVALAEVAEPGGSFVSDFMVDALEGIDGAVGGLALDGHGTAVVETGDDVGAGGAEVAFAAESAWRRGVVEGGGMGREGSSLKLAARRQALTAFDWLRAPVVRRSVVALLTATRASSALRLRRAASRSCSRKARASMPSRSRRGGAGPPPNGCNDSGICKWHIRHIYAKHGLSRQVELAQLVTSLADVQKVR